MDLKKKINAQAASFLGLAVAEDTAHPLQKRLKFVFTDFQPNGNKQGVPTKEAQNVASTAMFMPVKINYSDKPLGHENAVPIGPITSVNVTEENILGEAIFWADEYPDIAEWLAEASKKDGGVQFSWELYFGKSEKDDNGVEWLNDIVTAGITIVGNPAYQGRTPLLAFSEQQEEVEVDKVKVQEMLTTLYSTLNETLASKPENDDDFDTAFNTIVTKLNTTLTTLKESNSNLESEVTKLKEFKESVENKAAELAQLKSIRDKMLSEGIELSDEEFDARSGIFLKMNDEMLDLYIKDLASRKQTEVNKSESSQKDKVPDPFTPSDRNDKDQLSTTELAQAFKELARKR